MCGALRSEKNLSRLIAAYQRYRQGGGEWGLVLIGDGPQRQALARQAAGVPGVQLLPWQQYEQLPAYYGLASGFILPSLSEPWGVVVNEAMDSGLPVLLSRRCGCLPELCWKGINGYDFDPNDEPGMAQLMHTLSHSPNLAEMGAHSQEIVAHLTPHTWALAFLDCIAGSKAAP